MYSRISVYDAANRPQYSKYRCPICGELVEFRNGDCRQYFAHKRNSSIAENCPLHDVNKSSPYDKDPQGYYREKTGLPLYLEIIGDHFQFYLELPNVSKNNRNIIDQNIEIQICKLIRLEPVATILFSELSEQKPTLIPLNQVEPEYYFKYSAEYGLNDIPKNTSAFYDGGTFFYIRSKYSRKVSFRGEIRANVEYYLVTRKEHIPNRPFLEVIDIRPLITKNQNYVVCVVKFNEVTSDSCYFARKLNVVLVETPVEFIPIWPPMLFENKSYILTESATIFGKNLCNSESFESSFMSQVVMEKSVSITPPGHDNTKPTMINYDTTASYPQYQWPSTTIEWNNTPAPEKIIWIKSGTLSYASNAKCHLILTKNGVTEVVYKNSQKLNLCREIAKNSNAFIYHGHDLISHIAFSRKQKNQNAESTLTDDLLYLRLSKCQKNMIKIPSYLKHFGIYISSYPKTCAYLHSAIKQGKISADSIRTLTELQKTGAL
ncbi:hypothetical protein [Methanorbis rubei]|uniref:hypothetical protein n=1 Tax=Methanorbis rubei TaxID=3028300 RepID=UPI0030B8C1E7